MHWKEQRKIFGPRQNGHGSFDDDGQNLFVKRMEEHQERVRTICALREEKNEFFLSRALSLCARIPRASPAETPRSSCPTRAQIEQRRASASADRLVLPHAQSSPDQDPCAGPTRAFLQFTH